MGEQGSSFSVTELPQGCCHIHYYSLQ